MKNRNKMYSSYDAAQAMRSMRWIGLLGSVFLYFACCGSANGFEIYPVHKVLIPGMKAPVTIRIQKKFIPAWTEAERRLRQAILKDIEKASSATLVAAEVYATKWDGSAPFPLIIVGTLPTAVRFQGEVTDEGWKLLAHTLSEHARLSVLPLNQQMVNYGLPDCSDAMRRVLGNKAADTEVTFGFLPAGKNSDDPSLLSARKIKHVQQSLMVFDISVDASKAGAMESLESFLNACDVMK